MNNETEKQEAETELGGRVDTVVMRFKHDCNECIPLGQENDHDLYYCNKEGGMPPTLVARFGDAGPDYKSGMELAGHDNEITRALDLAIGMELFGEVPDA